MIIETPRLTIFPLTFDQLVLYLRDDSQLERELNLNEAVRVIPQALLDAFNETILPAVADPSKNYLYSTLWTVVCKERNQMVADLCFQGEPNREGEIEIGYGTYDLFQGMGFITEAIGAVVRWAFSQPKVKAIIAETDQTNVASHRVLEKNGFVRVRTSESSFWWRLERSDFAQ
ncbi:GNAT family N-acetyltransferase [Williamwhitmania taraxaci]|uniref:Protein N-acetyltransferase, RimJ/RimL family n=1 Tax=Williamwhitmania taraxaci TaxID=1640674 RepID=A0A1G6T8S2_9BACT|nr:GNAT family N-acetyltransferase [Williamwhitmania taraxaci]SDD24847.1 Protein N-acetyltransferase, RimJ/RimL family [Williamwhitmania taraxaci]